jgi:hypothetical protein
LPLATGILGNAAINTLATVAGVANVLAVSLYVAPIAYTLDQVGISVSTAVASARVRVVIYEADSDGRPTNLMFVSTPFDASTTGTKFNAASFTFVAGKRYYVGVWHSANATVRAVTAFGSPFGWSTAATPLAFRSLIFTSAFSEVADPPAWPAFANTQFSSNAPPFVMFRVAP